jgi:hypothetical protein
MSEYIVKYVNMGYTTGSGEGKDRGRTKFCTDIQSKINEMVTNGNEFVSQQIHGDNLYLFFKKKRDKEIIQAIITALEKDDISFAIENYKAIKTKNIFKENTQVLDDTLLQLESWGFEEKAMNVTIKNRLLKILRDKLSTMVSGGGGKVKKSKNTRKKRKAKKSKNSRKNNKKK